MTDILIYESGNGGEISIKNGDIETTDSLVNQFYLAHFGGNIEAITTGEEVEGEERNDWWGNFFLDKKNQMNSLLEKTLNEVPLNSSGRTILERNSIKDIEFLNSLGTITSEVVLTGNNKLIITDKINQTKVDFIWDATKSEIIEEITI